MPPRKRRTKLTARPKPKLPHGEDDDMNRNQRRNKMELLLTDFDLEVKNRLEQMQREAHKMCSMINTLFCLEVCKMNKDVLRMTRKEYLAKGGSISETALQEVSQYVDSLSQHITKPMQQASGSASKTQTNQGDSNAPPPPTKKKGRSKKDTTNKRKRKASPLDSGTEAVDENMMPPPTQSLRRSTRKTANTDFTPAQQTRLKRGPPNTCWNTPAVTPKFDPRLPVTPGARRARKGERLMSMTGSPVIPATTNATLSKDLKENILAVNNQIQNMNVQDEVARRNIQMLQDSLAKILHTFPAVKK